MPVTNYVTVNGRVVSQNKAGVYSSLLRDPLGNVIATANAAGTKANDTTYWPYGEVRTGGVSSVTSFGFCGTWGYYTDSSGRQYVRARYYRPTLGRWQTVDPLWPVEIAFEYARSRSTVLVDPTGTWPKAFGKYLLSPWPLYDSRKNPNYWGYGNWCGKNRPRAGFTGEPIDELDACCFCHDKDLGDCDCGGYSGMAHHNLVVCANKANCATSKYPKECSAAQIALITGITALIASCLGRLGTLKCHGTKPPCSPFPPPWPC